MEIQAAVICEQSGPFRMEQLELCDPNDDEVLVLGEVFDAAEEGLVERVGAGEIEAWEALPLGAIKGRQSHCFALKLQTPLAPSELHDLGALARFGVLRPTGGIAPLAPVETAA